tara:strand:+ start:10193 stop:11485 length:1293 start_codon:yes stop_codon:yes gene_type:complete
MIKNCNLENLIQTNDKHDKSNKHDKHDKHEKKQLYGEVLTPFYFVNEILDNIPINIYKNPNFKWLDPGAGTGNFSISLYYKLLSALETIIQDDEERKNHIIQNMIFMVELRHENIEKLKLIFGKYANIYHQDFLTFFPDITENFDVVIGNPPFNFNGVKKVPTNIVSQKKADGHTIWIDFVKKSISLLKPNGIMSIFIPSIWLKPDKEKMYYYLLQYNIKNLKCFSNTETNQIFKGNAQTPSCYFILKKEQTDGVINIYDREKKTFIDFSLKNHIPIPLTNIEIVNNFQNIMINSNHPHIHVIKTNLPPKNISISLSKLGNHKYPNIRTRLLKDKELIIEYSDKPLIGYGKPKLVLANKMYGLPYLDKNGDYGISNRDNYIIYKDRIEDLERLEEFLSTDIVQKVFEATRYRMKYLEKYAFELLPDITLN